MRKLVLSLSIIGLLVPLALCQPITLNLEDKIPVDGNVIIGKLDNGITYYIRQNKKPENRIELRLATNAGSILETEGQQGLAHFVEHMCFNGTKNFPKNELINALQKLGVEFGADINAYTSFDETVYMLQLPADNTELIDVGFQILEDWAHQVTFENLEIDKERGVIKEEWRLGLGANDRLRRIYFPVMFTGSKYAERLPIGKPEVIETFPYDTLRQFYFDWYRPDLQAVVVVGDIDPKVAEAKIKEYFGRIPARQNPRERTIFDVPGNSEPLVSVATDKEATSNMVMLFYKHPKTDVTTLGDYRLTLLRSLYTGMLNNRLSELNQKPDSPFLYASSFYGNFLSRSMNAYVNQGVTKANQIPEGLGMLIRENERVKRFGFHSSELERQKSSMMSYLERAAREADKTESGRLASEYVSNFLDDEPIPGAAWELEYAAAILPTITVGEINALAAEWISKENMVLIVTAPDKEGIIVPGKDLLLSTIETAQGSVLEPWIDNFRDAPLINTQLKGSKVAGTKMINELGFEMLTLKNGINVYLKKTDFKNDEILFSAFSHGGFSLYTSDDFMVQSQAAEIINQSGIGDFSPIELQKKLKGSVVSINPYISDTREGFRGSTRPQDVETMLQILYLYFTSPRLDHDAFNKHISSLNTRYQFMGANPTYVFFDSLYRTVDSQDSRTKILLSSADIDAINHQRAFDFYKERFANGADFSYYFVGNFDRNTLVPMLETYLGSLPTSKQREHWKNIEPKFPAGITNVTVHAGAEPKAMVGMVFSESMVWNESNRLYLTMLKEIIDIKLIEVIREEMSGVYSPSVNISMQKVPESKFTITVMFGCSPDNTENLTQAVITEINKIIANGPTPDDLLKAKEMLIRKSESDIQTNRFWLDRMVSSNINGDPYVSVDGYKSKVEAVSIDDLRNAAAQHLRTDHYVRGVLLPEKAGD